MDIGGGNKLQNNEQEKLVLKSSLYVGHSSCASSFIVCDNFFDGPCSTSVGIIFWMGQRCAGNDSSWMWPPCF
jgi:hypothetical protein